jgi:hypothetical protein
VTRVRDIIRLCGDRMTVFGGILGFESFVEGAGLGSGSLQPKFPRSVVLQPRRR